MKLYAYVLKSNSCSKEQSFHEVEFEVEEHPKTFTVTGELPRGIYIPSRLKKDSIGGFINSAISNGKVVILEKKDLGRAKELFNRWYDEIIGSLKEKIEKCESIKATVNDFKEDAEC